MPRPFMSRYEFTGACCGEIHPAGTEAVYEPSPADFFKSSRIRAVECNTPDHTTLRDGESVCDKCFLVHGSGQVDCS